MHTVIYFVIIWTVKVHCDLLNKEWIGEVQPQNLTFRATVPGGIYTDLLTAKLIPENLFGFNDVENRWVAHQQVNYVKYFLVNETVLQHQRLSLIFHGLDTFATIWVNDKNIGNSSNMFIRYNFDVQNHLKLGQNKLQVVFESSIAESNRLHKEQSQFYKIPPECVPPQYNGECHVNYIRKMQASYSWDWGPAFPSIGIWKNVELVPSNFALVTDVSTYIRPENLTWKVEVEVHFDVSNNSSFQAELVSILKTNEKVFRNSTTQLLVVKNNKASAKMLLEIPKDSVSLWWPNGYGFQYLYHLNFQAKTWNDTYTRDIKIGFRTVELIQEPLKKGFTFYFRVNGLPIFAKGSNWIPSSIFPELSSEEKTLRHLLTSSKLAHMNMLRVWGGGVYESERFYELADEMGIMIWQDFMFACAMYPTNEQFLESVQEEIRQNVRKLMNHPSVVLWAGNNENEAALYGNWYGTGTAEIYKQDYIKLYVDVIENLMKELDDTRPFLVSSPSNGLYAETNGRFGTNPQSTLYGDVHYYNYLRNGWNINQYPTARFSSEYGFQSLPFYSTLKEVATKPDDLITSSKFMHHRQHLPAGNIFLKKSIENNFDIPQSKNETSYDFKNFIYLSQINQAVSIKIESEHYRQMMSELNSLGEGRTMGALYWQLNDVWQAPSWSSIDFSGRWKMLHYYAVDFFAPVIVSPRISQARELSIYVISDLPDDVNDARIEIKIYKWDSFNPVFVKYLTDVTVKKRESKMVTSFWLDDFLVKSTNCGNLKSASKNCFIELELKNGNNQRIAPLNYVYSNDFKNLTVRRETFEVIVNTVNCYKFNITIKSNVLSLFVWLDLGSIKGRFSENGFHMTKHKKRLTLYTEDSITSVDIVKNVYVRSLYNIYTNFTLKVSDRTQNESHISC